jgi:hypothetical protein
MSTTITRWAIAVVVGLFLLLGAAVAVAAMPGDTARPSAPTSGSGGGGGGRISFS